MAVSAAHFPDPLAWDPHRWERVADPEADPKRLVDYGFGMVSASASSPYLPFGAGRHRCIGEQFAYVQLTTILALMVRNFRFANVEGRSGVVGTDYSVSLGGCMGVRVRVIADALVAVFVREAVDAGGHSLGEEARSWDIDVASWYDVEVWVWSVQLTVRSCGSRSGGCIIELAVSRLLCGR